MKAYVVKCDVAPEDFDKRTVRVQLDLITTSGKDVMQFAKQLYDAHLQGVPVDLRVVEGEDPHDD